MYHNGSIAPCLAKDYMYSHTCESEEKFALKMFVNPVVKAKGKVFKNCIRINFPFYKKIGLFQSMTKCPLPRP